MQNKESKIAHVFVDEYGDPNLDTSKKGTTPFFVYTAVVVLDKNLTAAENILKEIIKKKFQQRGYIKSNKIKLDEKGYNLQINIIEELKRIKHYIVCIVVDKKEIDKNGGLFYKDSFIKFFQKLLANQLTNKYDVIHIYMDNTGRSKFKNSVKAYMGRLGIKKDLFCENSFDFYDDITEKPLIQLADFYGGCIGRYLVGAYTKTQSDDMYNHIRSYTFVKWFPFQNINYLGAKFVQDDKFCLEIYNIAIDTANKFLQKNTDDAIGNEIVSFFLQESFHNPMRYISSNELKMKIEEKEFVLNDPISAIAKLRTKGVFLVSPRGERGYKFPCSEYEIADYFDRITNNVVPQLRRANILHRILIEQSCENHNILQKDEFSMLNDLIVAATNTNLIKR